MDECARTWHRIEGQTADELDAYAQACYARDRGIVDHRLRRDVEVERRREYLARTRKPITPNTSADELPWEIYGYGKRRK